MSKLAHRRDFQLRRFFIEEGSLTEKEYPILLKVGMNFSLNGVNIEKTGYRSYPATLAIGHATRTERGKVTPMELTAVRLCLGIPILLGWGSSTTKN
ncbi:MULTISPECIES: hypothetical protein [Moorena]|uniref:hypothetical protein n=1 Tax=Moorena TaxID=1155738 RepID=UPI0011EA70DB|nr:MULTISPECIES: hypothetical protein [Moorena]NEO76694.1 hypothetical protein [Moorena sp. SIO4G3]